MPFIITEKRCLECGDAFKGRKDKKFCSDQCRTTFNNRLKSDSDNIYVKTVNHALRKNRKILKELNPEGKVRVHADMLRLKGFNFDYFTSMYQPHAGGKACYYCYDHGYKHVDQETYLLIQKKLS